MSGRDDQTADENPGETDELDESEEPEEPEEVAFTVTIEDGETVVTMRGDRDTAVIVRSEMGERIYLPPEDFEREAESASPYQGSESSSPYRGAESSSPYQGAEEASPYRGIESDSPYQASRQELPSEGMVPTADGYRIRHPEPARDVRVLR
ncbi:MAG: hypothetical protein ABEJ97_03640 [Halobellus sp.]